MSVTVSGLTKVYGEQRAVDSISFSLKKGEIVGFLGPNGAGKSTTMKMVTGYLPPTEGVATVCGFDPAVQPLEARKRLGYLPEANPLYFDMYVREYLLFAAGIHGLGKASKTRVEDMIQRTGLSREAHKKLGALSKGYKQRAGLAQAMLHDPEVLILDEPTSGLDPNQIVEIRELITGIGKEKTVLLSTHIMQEVQAMCSRVLIIARGRLVADDPIEALQKKGGAGALVVQFEKAVDEASLRRIKGVKTVQRAGDNRFKLSTDTLDVTRREVMQWALNNDASIAAMQAETQSLEEVFRSLTDPSLKGAA